MALFYLPFVFLAVDEVIDRHTEVGGHHPKHIHIGGAFPILIMGERFSAHREIHRHLQLAETAIAPDGPEPDQAAFSFAHATTPSLFFKKHLT